MIFKGDILLLPSHSTKTCPFFSKKGNLGRPLVWVGSYGCSLMIPDLLLQIKKKKNCRNYKVIDSHLMEEVTEYLKKCRTRKCNFTSTDILGVKLPHKDKDVQQCGYSTKYNTRYKGRHNEAQSLRTHPTLGSTKSLISVVISGTTDGWKPDVCQSVHFSNQ